MSLATAAAEPPDDPPGTAPRRDTAFLPFFSRSTGPGYVNETFVWPLFGYTERTAPVRYSEQRFLWPFLVQGRGVEAILASSSGCGAMIQNYADYLHEDPVYAEKAKRISDH